MGILAIAAGGALGAVLRYVVSGWVQALGGTRFPWGTLAVNVVGSFARHTARILRLSEDLPIVIEVVDTAERIDALLPALDEMIEDGLVTIETVRILRYRPGRER